MKKFLLLNQDEAPICELEYGKCNAGVLELGSVYFVVNVVLHADGHAHAVALYRDVVEAAQAVQALRDFAFSVTKPNQAFAMQQASEPISPLEIINAIF